MKTFYLKGPNSTNDTDFFLHTLKDSWATLPHLRIYVPATKRLFNGSQISPCIISVLPATDIYQAFGLSEKEIPFYIIIICADISVDILEQPTFLDPVLHNSIHSPFWRLTIPLPPSLGTCYLRKRDLGGDQCGIFHPFSHYSPFYPLLMNSS